MQNVPYFRHLNKETIKEISLLMNTKHYVAGSLIVQRGDVLTDIYIIKEGVVEVEASTTPTEDQARVVKALADKPTGQVPTPGTPG